MDKACLVRKKVLLAERDAKPVKKKRKKLPKVQTYRRRDLRSEP